ncbi:DUF6359 domain-containing protein [Ureibacillus sp. NPDC094379]
MSKMDCRKYTNIFLATTLVASAVAPVLPVNVNAETQNDIVVSASTSAISVADAIANNSGKATVRGYVVGYVKSNTSIVRDGYPDDNNLAIAAVPGETDPTKMLFVQITSAYRAQWGLKSNPNLLGQQIDISGNLESYFSKPGLKNPTAFASVTDDEVPGSPGQSEEPPTPVEVISIANARAKAVGETVTIKGIVAADLKNTFSVQDETGGIAVRPTSLGLTVGDEVTLTGKLADYRGLLQLDSASIVEKGANNGAPQAKVVIGAEVNETNESKLVTVKNVTLNSVTGTSWKNFTANDGTNFIVRDETGELSALEVGTTYESITGIVQQFDNDYQIIPRSVTDIVVDSTTLKAAQASPAGGTFVGNTSVTLTTTTANAEIFYTLDGTAPTAQSTKYVGQPIDITKDTTLTAVVIAQDGTLSDVSKFEYEITDSLQIHDIQGEGHTSPFNNQSVEGLQGIVTYNFTLNGANYYTIQTPDELVDKNPNTSEAILLYAGKNAWPIEVGDLVEVSGKVSEYAYDGFDDRQTTDLKTTQINVRDDQGGKVEVVQSGVSLPSPITIDELKMSFNSIDSDELKTFNPTVDAIDFWETIEGMRVQVGNVKAVAPQEHGDLITVLEDAPTNSLHGGVLYEEGNANPNRIQFRLEPNGPARDFEVATGDKFTGPITGIVGYSFQNYKIYADLNEMKDKFVKGTTKPETTKIVKADDKLTIASYNLENFSNNSASNQTPQSKVEKLARAIGTDMGSPDIVGVTEVQDNNGSVSGDSQANQSYERLIAAIKAETNGEVEYKYLNIDPVNNEDGGAPNANIRVGFLYNPDRVSLPAGISAGDATTAVGYENGKLTLNPGRIDPTNAAFNSSRKPLAAQFNFQGEDVIVIANHWNSKSGDTPLFGAIQPPKYDSEIQRKKIAQIVYNFVNDIKTKNPDANIVSLGDFNDYQFADALKIHEGELMTNMINKIEEQDRYTYLYQGNSQVLDHILVSNNLATKTLIDILHINADFTDMAGRASDHDPVMVQIDLKADDGENPVDPVEPIKAKKVYNLNNFKSNKLMFTKDSVEVHLNSDNIIKNGVWFKGSYIELNGIGFSKNQVYIQPKKDGAIVDLKGTLIQELIIDGTNVKEVRGAENVQKIEYINGATKEQINFTNVKGEPIVVPSFPSANVGPVVSKTIENQSVLVGEEISINLTDYFSDANNDVLTFTSTKGIVNGNTFNS